MMLSTLLQTLTILLAIKIILIAATERPGHECKRLCVKGTPIFKCHYDFAVTEIRKSNTIWGINEDCEDSETSILVINGKTPGPTIEICLGDTVEVVIHNKLASQELSFHWNGINQLGSPHMDGVAMISQCPILPFSSFRYDTKPQFNGTYFYHAHSSTQQADGLYGALIVRDFGENFNYEKILIISTTTSSPLSWSPHVQLPKPTALTVNGRVDDELHVQSEREYRLRLINANVFNCPVAISIDQHPLHVTAIGSNPVQRTKANHIVIFPGEKLDVTLETNQVAGSYFLLLQGLHECKHLINKITMIYDNIDFTSDDDNLLYLDTTEEVRGHDCKNLGDGIICSMDLKTMESENIAAAAVHKPEIYYIPFDVNYYSSFTDDMTDYTFEIYGFAYYPSYLTINPNGAEVPQVNRMTFKYPSSPILSQPEAISDDIICSIEDRSQLCKGNPLFCECLQILPIEQRKTIEIILINEGKNTNSSQVFHTHGYSVSIIGVNKFDWPITRDEIISMDEAGLLSRNLINPPKMDTFVVPSKGYVIVRFYSDNLGYWLWEARGTGLFPATNGPTMQFLMRVGNRENLPTVPIDFPTCGSHKGPDFIFEDG